MEELETIIKGCIRGRADDQRRLYELFSRKMFALCLRYSRDQTEAEDVLQEGFMKVFDKIEDFGFRGSFEGWMRRIMINTALEKLRRKHYMVPLSEADHMSDDLSSDIIPTDLETADLIRMIRELSPQYQLVFNLYAIEGYSHKEIADMTGISEGTSKSNLARARAVLQQKLKSAGLAGRNNHYQGS